MKQVWDNVSRVWQTAVAKRLLNRSAGNARQKKTQKKNTKTHIFQRGKTKQGLGDIAQVEEKTKLNKSSVSLPPTTPQTAPLQSLRSSKAKSKSASLSRIRTRPDAPTRERHLSDCSASRRRPGEGRLVSGWSMRDIARRPKLKVKLMIPTDIGGWSPEARPSCAVRSVYRGWRRRKIITWILSMLIIEETVISTGKLREKNKSRNSYFIPLIASCSNHLQKKKLILLLFLS